MFAGLSVYCGCFKINFHCSKPANRRPFRMAQGFQQPAAWKHQQNPTGFTLTAFSSFAAGFGFPVACHVGLRFFLFVVMENRPNLCERTLLFFSLSNCVFSKQQFLLFDFQFFFLVETFCFKHILNPVILIFNWIAVFFQIAP